MRTILSARILGWANLRLRCLIWIVSDRVVPVAEAPQVAIALGEWGGWVDSHGRIHGAGGAWMLSMADTSSASKPAGTIVSMMRVDATAALAHSQ